eukprot:Skav222940  [mRNA]  locus=scaffold1489:503418:516491:- [translate_table: standard]
MRAPFWKYFWAQHFVTRQHVFNVHHTGYIVLCVFFWWTGAFSTAPMERREKYYMHSPKFRLQTAYANPGTRPAAKIAQEQAKVRYFYKGHDHAFTLNELKDFYFKLRENWLIQHYPGIQYPFVHRQLIPEKTADPLKVAALRACELKGQRRPSPLSSHNQQATATAKLGTDSAGAVSAMSERDGYHLDLTCRFEPPPPAVLVDPPPMEASECGNIQRSPHVSILCQAMSSRYLDIITDHQPTEVWPEDPICLARQLGPPCFQLGSRLILPGSRGDRGSFLGAGEKVGDSMGFCKALSELSFELIFASKSLLAFAVRGTLLAELGTLGERCRSCLEAIHWVKPSLEPPAVGRTVRFVSLLCFQATMPEEDEALQAIMAAVKRHFDAEEFEEALPLMTEAYKAKPGNPLVIRTWKRGESYIFTLVNVSQWENVLKACKKHTDLEDIDFEHAYSLYRLNRFEEALEILGSRTSKLVKQGGRAKIQKKSHGERD